MSYKVIHRWARENPAKSAMIHNGNTISYLALASAIGSTLDYLNAQSLSANHNVAVLISNLPDCWVTVLALQALGLNTICINTPEHLEILEIQDIETIVTMEQTSVKAKTVYNVVCIPKPNYESEDLSYCGHVEENVKTGGQILYTSGTTGAYKKVFVSTELQEQRNEERKLCYKNFKADTVYHCLNFGLWTAIGYKTPPYIWQMGGCIIFEQRPAWYQYFLQSGLTNAFLIPEQAHELVDYLEGETPTMPVKDICLLVAGGFISHKLAGRLRDYVSSSFENIYGSTEMNVPVLRSKVKEAEDLHWLETSGYRKVEIVDEFGNICPVDQEGELRVCLTELDSNSYLDNPNTTEKVFRSGYFYPGDMAVQRADNRIRILGRSADVINFRGQKHSVAPIEDAIQNLLNVKSVCLFSGIDSGGEEEVLLAIESPHWPERSSLEYLSKEFAQFDKVRFVRAYPFPRTQTGTSKINRVALRKEVFSAEQ